MRLLFEEPSGESLVLKAGRWRGQRYKEVAEGALRACRVRKRGKGQRGPSDEGPEMEPKLECWRGANAAWRLPRDAYIAGNIAEMTIEVEGYRDTVDVGED